MFVHIGKSVSVDEKEIIGIFDIENASISGDTKQFLKNMQLEMKTVSLCDDLPKTFILCDNSFTDTVYITQLSPEVTKRRIEEKID